MGVKVRGRPSGTNPIGRRWKRPVVPSPGQWRRSGRLRNNTVEIVSAPKVYGFDTGFVCCHRGWHDMRREDMGALWEHIVLNELHGRLQTRDIRYWRDKRGHEIDFVIAPRGGSPTAIECKMTASDFDPTGIKAFRRQYPEGKNYAVAHDVDRGFRRTYDAAEVEFVSLPRLIEALSVGRG